MKKDAINKITNKIDNVSIQLERILFMLQLLEEDLDREVDYLKENGGTYGEYFAGRYVMYRSQLVMAEIWLNTNRDDLENHNSALRDYLKKTEAQE